MRAILWFIHENSSGLSQRHAGNLMSARLAVVLKKVAPNKQQKLQQNVNWVNNSSDMFYATDSETILSFDKLFVGYNNGDKQLRSME